MNDQKPNDEQHTPTDNDSLTTDDVQDEISTPPVAESFDDVDDELPPDDLTDQDDDLLSLPDLPTGDNYTLDPLPDLSSGLAENRFDLDIDAALSALGSLSDVVAEQSAGIAAERARLAALKADEDERREAARISAEEYARWKASYHMAHPHAVRLQRGKLASILPALLLIASGAYLTFALTLPDIPRPEGYIPAILFAVFGLVSLSYWLTSGRWARGALLAGASSTLIAGVLAWLEQSGLTPLNHWALFVVASGAATLLTGIFGRPRQAGVTVFGLAVMLGGIVASIAQSGLIDPALWANITPVAPFVLGGALVLVTLALIFRRNPAL